MNTAAAAPELRIDIADVIVFNGEDFYRVIYQDPGKTVVTAVNMFRNDTDIRQFSMKEVYEGVYATHTINIVSEENYRKTHPDFNKGTDENNEKYKRNKSFIDQIIKAYGPDYMGLMFPGYKPDYERILSESGVSRQSFRRIILVFLKSGLRYKSLMPQYTLERKSNIGQNRRGRKAVYREQYSFVPTMEDMKHMAEFTSVYMKNRPKSIRSAYDSMNDKYYRIGTSNYLLPPSQRPTYEQFRYFVHKATTFEERRIKETSAAENRNDNRVLVSDSTFRVKGAGDLVEIDEMSLDFYCCKILRPDQCIGRFIVYFMVDVWSRAIIAASVSTEDNSALGFSNLLLNLADDKKELCKRYGLDLKNPNLWPTGYLPLRYRCDKGSEYLSNYAEEITSRLDFTQESVPAATGSLKPNVEQKFNQMNKINNSHLKGKGLIEKRHDSDHKKTAVMNIWDATRLVYSFVIYYNELALKNYPNLTPEMIDLKLDLSPATLWEYSIKKNDRSRKIVDIEEYRKKLMQVAAGTASRRGICFKGRYYLDPTDERQMRFFRELNGSTKKVNVRYDPRDNSAIFATLDRTEVLIPMNLYREGQKPYCGLAFQEDEEHQKKAKRNAAENTGVQDNIRANQSRTNKEIVNNAKKRSRVYAVSTNMKQNRKDEKEIINHENSIIRRIAKDRTGKIDKTNPDLPAASEENVETTDITADETTFTISDPIVDSIDCSEDISELSENEEKQDSDESAQESLEDSLEEEEEENLTTEDEDEAYYDEWLEYNRGVRYP